MNKPESSAARERLLDVAEQLFSEHGYATVTLRDIAARLQIKVASLYYHVPNGKEELFIAVIERMMHRHQTELNRVIAEHGTDWQAQLFGIAHWLLSQPPIDTTRMMYTDANELSPEHSQRLMSAMFSVMQPIEQVFENARVQTGKPMIHPGILAGVFTTIINGINQAPLDRQFDKVRTADDVLNIFIKGLLAD
jgi:AcrR family transcriptional regulator